MNKKFYEYLEKAKGGMRVSSEGFSFAQIKAAEDLKENNPELWKAVKKQLPGIASAVE